MPLIIRCLPLALVSAALLGQTAPRPNIVIVLFLSDGMRWVGVGCNGGTAVPTPNIARITDSWPLASLAGLEALALRGNWVRDLHPLMRLDSYGLSEVYPLAGLEGSQDLGLAGSAIEDLGALSDLSALRRLGQRGNPAGVFWPLRALPSLVWGHVGGSRIEDISALERLPDLTVAGRDDQEPQSVPGEHGGRIWRR